MFLLGSILKKKKVFLILILYKKLGMDAILKGKYYPGIPSSYWLLKCHSGRQREDTQ